MVNLSADPEALKALEVLAKSRGWAVLRERMERELREAGRQLVSSPSMGIDEIHFRRGAMWAAEQLLNLPDRLIPLLTAEVMIAESHQSLKPAKRVTQDAD